MFSMKGMSETDAPPTGHLIQAKEKFNDLYKSLKQRNTELEEQLVKSREKTFELQEKERILRGRFTDAVSQSSSLKDKTDLVVSELKSKLALAVKAREDILDREYRVKDQHQEAKKENDNITKIIREKNLEDAVQQELYSAELARLKEEINLKENIVEDLKLKRAENLNIISRDQRLKVLKERNAEVIQILAEKEKELADINYHCFEMEHLQKLAIKQKEVDADERRQLYEEYERLKHLVEETEKMNNLKVQRKIRENDSTELKKLEAILIKEQRELAEVKEKWGGIHSIYKRIRGELDIQNEQILKMKLINSEKEQKNDEMIKKINELMPMKIQAEKAFELNEQRSKDLTTEKDAKEAELHKLELELSGLKSKEEFLNKNFNFSQTLGNIDLEDLKQQVSSNLSVNETIQSLLSNWDQMKKLGR